MAALGGPPAPANDPRTPEGQGRYIERQEALAIQPDGNRVLFTNIDQDAGRRAEFWRLVEEHETEAGPDRMTFTVADAPEFWARAAAHADCPPALSEAIRSVSPDVKATIDTDDNVAMRRFLSGLEGWKHNDRKQPGETKADYDARKGAMLAKFHDGRGGRVQYRIIGELPHELDVAGRASILREFSNEFEKRNLPFVSVMHAPDHTNNDKNWHFHLVYYDRPCARLTDERIQEYFATRDPSSLLQKEDVRIGAWDFTIQEEKKDKWRNRWTARPFEQDKVKDVAQDSKWIERMRERLSVITNDHLEKAGIERRLDPRRHSEMGIHADPQEHLGTKLANLEAMGVPTPTGVSNEERQWAAVQTKMDRDIERRRNGVDRAARRWLQDAARATHLDDEARTTLRGHVTRWHQHRTESEEHLAIAENLDQHIDRTMSRARKVKATCEQHMKAIDAGKATRFQASRAQQLQRKADEAVEWLVTAAKLLEDENRLSKECREASARERLLADDIELTIERVLQPQGVREVAATERREREEAELQREAGRRRDEADRTERERREAANDNAVREWVDRVARTRRRLHVVDGEIRPVREQRGDERVTTSPAYADAQSRLAGIKARQDAEIARVVAHVQANPRDVVAQVDERGGRAGHVLVTSDRALAQAFRAFGDDEAVTRAKDAAIAANAERARAAGADRAAADREAVEAAREAAERREDVVVRTPETAPRETPRTVGTDADVTPGDRTTARVPDATPDEVRQPTAAERRRAQVAEQEAANERIVRAVRDEVRRVQVGADGRATLSERNMREMGIGPEDLENASIQRRLSGLAGVQDREIKRLTGFARKNPTRIVERDGRVTVSRAPPEMREIAARWEREDSVSMALAAIRREAAAERTPAPKQTPVRANDADARRDADATPRTAPADPVRPEPAPAGRDAAPTPVEPPRPELVALTPDMELRAQARARAQEVERRRQAEAGRAAVPTREQLTGEDDITRAVRVAAERAGTAGAHPLIDRWRDAVRDGIAVEERRLLALAVENDRAAREKLRTIDRSVAQRIRLEAERARDEMQPGLDLDRGLAPRR